MSEKYRANKQYNENQMYYRGTKIAGDSDSSELHAFIAGNLCEEYKTHDGFNEITVKELGETDHEAKAYLICRNFIPSRFGERKVPYIFTWLQARQELKLRFNYRKNGTFFSTLDPGQMKQESPWKKMKFTL